MLHHGLLNGVRVIEFGQIAAGPFAGSLFADLGADVVKVERPDGGDGMRNWPPLTANGSNVTYSENFASLNRNKRSITANFKDPEDLARLRRLCAQADVVIENFRAGALKRSGLGYEDLKQMNPGLVYCSISGYGQMGPYAGKGAFDVTVQAISGVMSVTGEEDHDPVKCGVPIGDFCAALYGAYTVAAALLQRQRTGEGTYIDCSMLGSLIGVSALQTSQYFGTGVAPRPFGSAHPRNAPYQAFRGRDKHFVIAAGNDKLWSSVCDALGVPHLVKDPRFVTQELRARHQSELVEILQPLFELETAAYWLEEMDKRGVPCAPINTYEEILNDPHVAEMGLVRDQRLPNGVMTRTTGYPVAIAGFKYQTYRTSPELGAHNEEVAREWLEEEAPGADRDE